MVIGSTMFQHKNVHKPTWTAPDRSFERYIDHMVIDARHMSDLMDIRSYRGGNMDSNHYLVIARMRARISNIKKIRGERIRKFCISKLQDENMTNMYAKRLEESLAVAGKQYKKKGIYVKAPYSKYQKFWEGTPCEGEGMSLTYRLKRTGEINPP